MFALEDDSIDPCQVRNTILAKEGMMQLKAEVEQNFISRTALRAIF